MSLSYNQSYLAYRISQMLNREEQYHIHIELTLNIEGIDLIPDIAVYARKKIDFLHDKIKTDELPKLVVDILSPKQVVNEITDKFEIYLNAGIKSCWLVIPPVKTIVIFNEIEHPHAYSQGELNDPVMNIHLNISDIFGLSQSVSHPTE